MANMIDGERIYRFLTDQLVKETGMFSKGVNKGLNIARSALRNEQIAPTIAPTNEWVSVEDELPDPGKNVLLCFSGHTNSMVVGGRYEVGDGWYSIVDGEYYTDCDTPPTHWMWLPRLPEVDA